jgi:catechol 2,3-dioxygenase-like lactoylglutathione lyase family enzyme
MDWLASPSYASGMAAVLREIVIDCNDPRRVSAFWAEVLGWRPQARGDFYWMSESGGPFPGPLLVFVPVPEPKTVKDRIHIDVAPSGCNRDDEVARLEGLGATRVDIGQGDPGWVVLADPEGHEFCVLGRRIDAPA